MNWKIQKENKTIFYNAHNNYALGYIQLQLLYSVIKV